MNILKKILNYLSTAKGQRNALLVILILCVIYFKSCTSENSIDSIVYEQNVSALTDSIRVYKTKNNELIYEKSSLLTSIEDLKVLNNELAEEIKYLKDNPIVIIKWKTKIIHDTMYLPVVAGETYWNKDSTIKSVSFSWKYDTVYVENNYRKLAGKYLIQVDTLLNVVTKSFMISTDEIGMSFTTGLTESKDGNLEIFIKTPYPGLKLINVDGALINPRESNVIKKFFPPKRWSISPYIGYGVYFDPIQYRVGSGINTGISISYGIIQWKGKK